MAHSNGHGAGLRLGFTGTRDGMTAAQAKAFRALLDKLRPVEFHHGDCIGSDEDAHEIFHKWRRSESPAVTGIDPVIHVHPPDNDSKRARVKLYEGDVLHEEQSYHVRNKAIVDAGTLLVATPNSPAEQLKSGTWWTIRAAKKAGTKFKIIRPDGSITAKLP
jgi:hypothetical protein